MKNVLLLALALMLPIFVGCEVPELDIPETEEDRLGKVHMERNKQEMEEAKQASAEPAAQAETKPAETKPAAEAPAANEPKEFTNKDSKKGKKSRQAGGYLGAVGSARFTAENSMIINNIKHALNLYQAEHGRYPKTHEEFMEKIIKFNKIQLPELEADEEYFYDPEEPLVLKFRKKQQ